MNRAKNAFISKTKRYLRANKIPYMDIDGSKNILVLRASNEYHYLAIQFYDMPDSWVKKTRYFDIKTAYGNDYNQLVEAIDRYFNATA